MRVLGLDPSLSSYGWCILETEGRDAPFIADRGLFMTSPRQIEVRRYLHLRACLSEVIAHYKPEWAGLETPYFGGDFSEGLYALFVFNQEALYKADVDTVYFSPSQLKTLARGHASGKKMFKSDMVEAAKQASGVKNGWNADMADAYHAAKFAHRFWLLAHGAIQEDQLSEVENHIFVRRHTFTRGKRAGVTEEEGLFFKKYKRWFPFSKLKGEIDG